LRENIESRLAYGLLARVVGLNRTLFAAHNLTPGGVVKMLLEIHCHTVEHSPCSHVSAVELINRVYAKGLQGVVFTDHHFLWPAEELQEVRHEAGVPGYFLILSGQEVTTSDMGDVLVYGANESIPRDTSLSDIRTRQSKAALILAHPYRNNSRPERAKLLNPFLDGVEIFSSNQSVSENSRGLRDWHAYRFTAIAGTDTHAPSYAGIYPTQFDHPVDNIKALAAELQAGRCRPFFKEIPKAGSQIELTEITIGTKGDNEIRERIIVKHLHDKEKWNSAKRAYHIMEVLGGHGFDQGLYRIPRPIDRDEESMTLMEQGLRGKTLFDKLIQAHPDNMRYYVQLAAQWLAKLHSCRLQITPPEEFLQKEESRLNKYVERFQNIRHPHTHRAQEVMEAVRKAEFSLFQEYPERLVQGHGDYHPKNIYIGQDKLGNPETVYVAAIDFDSSACLPPAFDVGTFIAQFNSQFFDFPKILEILTEDVFLEAYLQVAKKADPDFLHQVDLFRARNNLSIAAFLIKVGLGDSEKLWRALVAAERAMTHFTARG
jgi:predicted metal-dependent phosphoesterase TrpH